ncbi:MAG TPA: hypothetical protein VK540_26475 [Polyangiaceae bacterium]|jgi:hypothetical protein|nr:hypothetical protein [Polyangiaceae bacterium]
MRKEHRSLLVGFVAAGVHIACGSSESGVPTDPSQAAGRGGSTAGASGSVGSGGSPGSSGSVGAGGAAGSSGEGGTSGSAGSSGFAGSSGAADSGGSAGSNDAGGGKDQATRDAGADVSPVPIDANVEGGTPPNGPFSCTELMGLLSSGEWWDAGFYDGLGADLKPRWQGRFSHYGYTYEYANPASYAWSPVNVGGTNNVRLTTPCAQSGSSPDRIVYQAWTWELTTEAAWIQSLEAALATIRAKRPSAKRIDLMTIIRCPKNLWCHSDKPPLGPNTDHDATKQDCHVPDYVDAAFAKVAAAHPDLVAIAPKFEAHACPQVIDGIHLHEQNGPAAADIAAHFKTMP